MSWRNILKADTEEDKRAGLEIDLEQGIDNWGMDIDISEWEHYSSGGRMQGLPLLLYVSFEDGYEGEEELSQEEIMENDEGHYLINLNTNDGEEVLEAQYTYDDGWEVLSYTPEKLTVMELYESLKFFVLN
jgi:hypothetical protein